MASWRDAKLFFCILFITCCFTVTLAEIPIDCCLAVKNQTLPKAILADYYQQAKGCQIDATIFVTRKARKLCVPPREKWVQQLMSHVDELQKCCKKANYKGKRCSGVKPRSNNL
ncbi:C-C motif chemokine 4 homolog [Odontesthes bonariensis]|uniref:C-C motif chemokine 4 homolog n=1 Tax=Odontesthes bonariensis TaxID=219752 RepID=UPI003F58CF0A